MKPNTAMIISDTDINYMNSVSGVPAGRGIGVGAGEGHYSDAELQGKNERCTQDYAVFKVAQKFSSEVVSLHP